MRYDELPVGEVELRRAAVRIVREDSLAHPDLLLGHIDDDAIGRTEVEGSIPVLPHLGDRLLVEVRVEGHVGGHEQARLHLVGQIASRVARRMVCVDRVAGQERGHALDAGADLDQLGLLLGHIDIAALGVLRVELARATVSGPSETQPVPIQAIARSPILGVGTLPVDDLDAVLFVDHASVVAEVEFVDLDVPALSNREHSNREHAEGVSMPARKHLHALDHLRSAVLGGAT
jgi:hypothetical protein